MKIGLVGYARSGKSTLFRWLTGAVPDPALAHATQAAMAVVPDPRVGPLCEIYHPKKVTQAALELVDTPGLQRDHQGSAQRLALIREAGCLVLVVGAFDRTNDPREDFRNLHDDFILADMEIVTNRIERLQESIKKPRPNREEQVAELAVVEAILRQLEAGKPVREMSLSKEAQQFIRSFGLLTKKPRMAIVNLGDDFATAPAWDEVASLDCPILALPIGLEAELEQMEPAEQESFREDLGLPAVDRGSVIRQIMTASGQMLFFTAGEKEVRTWMIRIGGTALEAADGIHSDLARGFIRAEVMSCDDLIRLGSEREVKAQHGLRQEPKDYVIQDGDILNIRFSV